MLLLAMSAFAAIWDLHGEVLYLVETRSLLMSKEAVVTSLLYALLVAVSSGCTYAEFLGDRRSRLLVPIVLFPLVILSIFGIRGLYLAISEGDFIRSIQGPRGPSTAISLLFIPVVLIYFGATVMRWRYLKGGEIG